ncbi:MAG: hypothetical protein LBD72_03340 [Puniceicoccales bacterium]|jgi:hypothetical protein|nr:hypothetical protein [Puniceicoccales bacterium]
MSCICGNLRQLAQFQSLSKVAVYASMQNVIVEDIKHLIIEAKNSKIFEINLGGSSQHITKEMAERAMK